MQVIFATRCFTTIVLRLTNSQNKVALTIMRSGSNASALRVRAKKNEQEKTAMGAEVGSGGRGREIFPLHFFSSVFFSSSHSPLYSN